MKAIVVESYGGSDALKHKELDTPAASAGEAIVRVKAIGVNYIDVYHRTGLYPLPLPFIPGMEAAGVIEEVGEGVSEFSPGDRVAYAMVPGSYAEAVKVPAARLVRIPDNLDFDAAAACMLQGMTAHYLAVSTYPLKDGDAALVHAAAGGVGLLLIQIAKLRGAQVIGTVSTEAKARLALEAGADEVIIYTEQDFEEATKRLTAGRGAQVVYDSVGKDTFMKSLGSLAPRGMLVLFGQSSGPVQSFDPALLAQKGSLFLTRPSLAHYALTREELLGRASDVFDWITSGGVKLRIERAFPLAEASEAHALLEARKTTGKLLLIP